MTKVFAAQVGNGNPTVHRAFASRVGGFTACGAESRGQSSGVREVQAETITCKRCGQGPVTAR